MNILLEDYYGSYYRGKTIILDVQGACDNESLAALKCDISKLLRFNINFIISSSDAVIFDYMQIDFAGLGNIKFASKEDLFTILGSDNHISEIIILSEEGGIKQKDKLLNMVFKSNIPQLEKKMILTELLNTGLSKVPKLVLTKLSGLYGEIMEWRGSGTMIVDEKNVIYEKLGEKDKILFYEIYKDLVKKGKFKERSQYDIVRVISNHYIIKVGESILGGASLLPYGDFTEVCNVWAGYEGGGIGGKAIEYAISSGSGNMFAMTTSERTVEIFERLGFQSVGTINNIRENTDKFNNMPDVLKKTVTEYDTSSRNPFMVVKIIS